jgi:2-iminobutanoate/2-iminopropanoate deaminase
MSIHSITTDKAPIPLGHYSQAIVHNGLVFVSGQLPVDPKDPSEARGSAEEQARLVLEHVQTILVEAGSDKSKVLKVTIYLADLADWGVINQEYARFFGDHKPARSAVPTNALPRKSKLEVEVIAAL